MKLTDHRLQLTVLILLFLPLFGWGCADKSVVSNKPEAGQDTVASVDTLSPLDTANSIDTSALDTIKPTDTTKPLDTIKPKDTTLVDTSTKDVSNVPEGWKVYEDSVKQLFFSYPATWYIAEQEGADGFYVFLADKTINKLTPEPVTPITIIRTSETFDETKKELLEQDDGLLITMTSINGQSVPTIKYQSQLSGVEYIYFGEDFQLWHTDKDEVKQIAIKIFLTVNNGGK